MLGYQHTIRQLAMLRLFRTWAAGWAARLAFQARRRLAWSTPCLLNNGNPRVSGKTGYKFSTGTERSQELSTSECVVLAVPLALNHTGIRAFCTGEDGVVRGDPAGACSKTEAGVPDVQSIELVTAIG